MFRIWVVLSTVTVLSLQGPFLINGGNVGGRVQEFKSHVVDHGIILAANAYEAICWYEYLKNYIPKTRSLSFNECNGQGTFQKKMLFKQRADERYFGKFLLQYAMDKLPDDYLQCSQYLLEDRYASPQKDYSLELDDSYAPNNTPYPYQAFSYCLAATLHKKYGDGALNDLARRLTKSWHWADAMFERENEFRALHNTKPLKLNDELNYRAQKWADQLARDCQMYHIHSSHPDYRLNGSRMGENLFTGGGIQSAKEDMTLFGTNIWYEEIEYYPWPEYKGYGDGPFHKFAHFSQMIWNKSELVGYGFAANSNENCGQYFFVSRYFPPGNNYGTFKDNVLPLKSSSN